LKQSTTRLTALLALLAWPLSAQVLKIVYLNATAPTMGGFFPEGMNGNIA